MGGLTRRRPLSPTALLEELVDLVRGEHAADASRRGSSRMPRRLLEYTPA